MGHVQDIFDMHSASSGTVQGVGVSGWPCRLGFCNWHVVCYFIGVYCHPALCLGLIVLYCHGTHDSRDLPLGLAFGGEPVLGADFDGGK